MKMKRALTTYAVDEGIVEQVMRAKKDYEKREGVSLSMSAFIAKLVSEGLKAMQNKESDRKNE